MRRNEKRSASGLRESCKRFLEPRKVSGKAADKPRVFLIRICIQDDMKSSVQREK